MSERDIDRVGEKEKEKNERKKGEIERNSVSEKRYRKSVRNWEWMRKVKKIERERKRYCKRWKREIEIDR